MDNLHPNFTQTATQFFQRLSVTVAELLPGLSVLEDGMQRWRSTFQKLIGEVHKRGGMVGNDDDEIFSSFLREMDATLDGIHELRINKAGHQRSEFIDPLEARVYYHIGATALISANLQRDGVGYMPDAQLKLKRLNEEWFEQKADLETRLKQIFNCDSSDLLWDKVTASNATIPPLSSPSLNLMRNEARVSFPRFPLDDSFRALLRAAIYFLSLVEHSLQSEIQTGPATAEVGVNFWKSAWLVHLLIKEVESRLAAKKWKSMTGLILEKLLQACPTSPSNIVNVSYGISIRDPLDDVLTSITPVTSSNIESPPYTEDNWSGISVFTTPCSPTTTLPFRPLPEEFEKHQLLPTSQSSKQTFFSAEPTEPSDETIKLSIVNPSHISKPENWIMSEVSIQRIHQGKMSLKVCQGGSLEQSLEIDPETDELVPGYAYGDQKCPFVLLRQNGKDHDLCFITKDIKESIYFTEWFVEDKLEGYFPSGFIESINIQSRNGSGSLIFSRPTAQIWSETSDEPTKDCGQSLQSVRTRSSFCPKAIEPIGKQIKESKILFFCRNSIYSLFITDQMKILQNRENGFTISCKTVDFRQGSSKQLAGIPMRQNSAVQSRNDYSSINLTFSSPGRKNDFYDDFLDARNRWLEKAQRLKEKRTLQRSPIIESRSYLHQTPRSPFP